MSITRTPLPPSPLRHGNAPNKTLVFVQIRYVDNHLALIVFQPALSAFMVVFPRAEWYLQQRLVLPSLALHSNLSVDRHTDPDPSISASVPLPSSPLLPLPYFLTALPRAAPSPTRNVVLPRLRVRLHRINTALLALLANRSTLLNHPPTPTLSSPKADEYSPFFYNAKFRPYR